MNPKYRQTFEDTGMCLDHKLEDTKPFRTAEGVHTFKMCRTCKKAVVNYKGETRKGPVSELLSFVSQKGIDYENGVIDLFGDIGKKQEVPNLFDGI